MSWLIRAARAALLIAFSAQAPAKGEAASLASQFPARILSLHNVVRAQAGVPPLSWDPALGQQAASYATELALTNSFHHSDRNARQGTGENLWMGTRGAYSYEAMVGSWSSERRNFVPGVFPAVSRSGNWQDVGHYTQMVWPTTTRIGCALVSNKTTDFLICRYASAGNIDGRRVP
ncbi:MAG TPA: CAP domain-containing protein [Sphingomicrobium sp.]|nr:CAP domain-containing protein [Sphingomicrobium sp.]